MMEPSFPSNGDWGVEGGREVVGWKIDGPEQGRGKTEKQWGGGWRISEGVSCLTLPRGTRAASFWVVQPLHSPPPPPPPLLHKYQEVETPSTEGFSSVRALTSEAGWRPQGLLPSPGLQSLEVEGAPHSPPRSSECRGTVTAKASPGSLASFPGGQGHRWSCTCSAAGNLERKARSPCLLLRQRPRQGSPPRADWSAAPLPTALAPQNACHPQGPRVPPPLLPSPHSFTHTGPVRGSRA